MNRTKFLSILGSSFIGLMFVLAKKNILLTDCDDPISPPVPEGPFYKNEKLNRIDITENKQGVPIKYIFRVEDEHCKPIPGAIVDIWQCDKDGRYSDFKVENTLDQTWLRGFQKTNQDGVCEFKTIFPGWYKGRVTHLHAKVHIDDKTVLTTNLFFPKEFENKIYQNPLYSKGPNPISILEDIELRVDKDTKRHDTLVMQISHNEKGEPIAQYTIAIV
jgi:protocatechuate 3,4-dioxygenase beta subunit